MTALLQLGADPADVRRAFRAVVDETVKANRAMTASAQRYTTARMRMEQDLAAANGRTLNDTRRTVIANANIRARAERAAAAARDAGETNSTAVANREERKRISASMSLQRQRSAALMAQFNRDEAEKTRIANREERRRAAGARQVQQSIGAIARGGAQFASQAFSEIQSARQRQATAGHSLTSVFKQAGHGVAESELVRARFAHEAQRLGIPLEVLTQAAASSQEEFSDTFTGQGNTDAARAADRQMRLDRFMRRAERARNMGGAESISQSVRLGGLIDQIGGSEESRDATLAGVTRLGELGSVEMQNMLRTGMRPIMQRVSQAQGMLGPGSTQAERSAAGQNAVMQTVAEMEVLRGTAGYNPLMAGNNMASINAAVHSFTTQDKMLRNIRSAQGMTPAERTAAEQRLFVADPTRRSGQRLRANSALEFIEQSMGAFGGNSTMMQNVFGGGGHGNPQSLQANWRRLSAALYTRDAEGHTGGERIHNMIAQANAAGSPAELERRRQLEEADPMTQLARNQEAHDAALTDNTRGIVNLSNTLANMAATNPLFSLATSTLGGGMAAALTGGATPGGGVASLLARNASPGAANVAGGVGGGTMVLGAAAAGIMGLQIGDAIVRKIDELTGTKSGGRGHELSTGPDSVFNPNTLVEAVHDLRDVFTGGRVVVGVAPHAAAQLAAVSATRRPPR